MNESQWIDVLALWADLWPTRPLPPESAPVWYAGLRDLPADDVAAALVAIWNDPDGNGWPPLSAGQVRSRLDPGRTWEDALGQVAQAIRSVGRYQPCPDFDDPAITSWVTSMGGWRQVCDTVDVSDPTVRAQFRDAYTAATRRVRDTATLDRVRGEVTGGLLALGGPS